MKPNQNMCVLQNNVIILQPLQVSDAEAFYDLYHKAGGSSIENGETPAQFTQRIISLCVRIWTIRPFDDPKLIIGDCALHHMDEVSGEIQIGGSLLADKQRLGYMTSAFQLVIDYAAKHLHVAAIVGHTTPDNIAAINLVNKLGFEEEQRTEQLVILKKKLGWEH